MNLSESDVNAIAQSRASSASGSKNLSRLVMLAFVLVVVGLMMFFTRHYYGVGLVVAGFIVALVSQFIRGRRTRKYINSFMGYYKEHGKIPPE